MCVTLTAVPGVNSFASDNFSGDILAILQSYFVVEIMAPQMTFCLSELLLMLGGGGGGGVVLCCVCVG